MVVHTDAVVDPRAMMVVARHTAVAFATVLRSDWSAYETVDTKVLTGVAASCHKVFDDLHIEQAMS